MSSSFDWSKYETVETQKEGSGFDWSEYETVKEQPSRVRSLISAPVKGFLKGLQEFEEGVSPVIGRAPFSGKVMQEAIESLLPTQKKTAERILERGGKIVPLAIGGGGPVAFLTRVGGATAAGELAKKAGLGKTGQDISEAIGMGLPELGKQIGKKLVSSVQSLLKPAEKQVSGLSKLAAQESRFASKALITSSRQQKVLQKLDQEASSLLKASVQKELPLAKKIEEGFDFGKQFEKDFGKVQEAASKANPTINISPVEKQLSETAKKYSGIPKLHPEAEKILSEAKALYRNPQNGLKNLLKIYRSNNQKIKNIYETSRLTGKQQEYVDFLSDLNKNITKSIEQTLPSESVWLKQFKSSNKNFKDYNDTLKTLKLLEPAIGENPSLKRLEKFATDQRLVGKLKLSMGEKGAQEIVQISKDLKSAKDAIKSIPVKDFSKWNSAFPVSLLLGWLSVHIPQSKTLAAVYSGVEGARRGFGYFLSSPKRQIAYQGALKAISENNLPAYIKATQALKQSASPGQEEEDDQG